MPLLYQIIHAMSASLEIVPSLTGQSQTFIEKLRREIEQQKEFYRLQNKATTF